MVQGTHSYLEDDRNKSIKIYVNGKILSRADASISVFDSGFLLGDINGDEILNVLDIVLIINMILINEYSVVADVNEDESVDVLDVVLMVNILVGGLPQSN